MTTLPFDDSPGAPWLTIPPHVRAAFDTITQHGTPLAHTTFGRPYLGVKCGCNDAFIVHEHETDETPLAIVTARKHHMPIERTLLRPLIRGESVRPWSITPSNEHIIWTHDLATGIPLRTLPPHAHAWFAPWRTRLQRRSDARHHHRWWALFRTEAASSHTPRVIWGDLGVSPRAAVLLPNDPAVPLNTCYVIHPRHLEDALALTALINSPLVSAWLRILAEPARGNYRRFLGWTMALLPVPTQWHYARPLLAELTQRALNGQLPTTEELVEVTIRAYTLRASTIKSLLEWDAQ